MKKALIFVFLGSSLIFSSCKKDSDPTKKEMIVGKNWVVTAFTVDPAYPIIGNNLYNQIAACTKDDITKFAADGKATFDEGASKCQVTDPQTTTGSWAFNTNETVLSVTTANNKTTSLTIKTLTSSKIAGNYQEVISGVTYTYDLTFEAK